MQQVPFVKICGLSTPESVDCAVQSGADAIGLVFAPGSPRLVTPDVARELVALVPPGVETVGVFRKQPIAEVLAIAQSAGVANIQFHGYEPIADAIRAKAAGFGVFRAFAVDEYLQLTPAERELWDAERLLIDALEPGSGVPFDPALIDEVRPKGWWLLAGGLNPTNVAGLIADLQPAGVDVSSGVEISRGVKSPTLIREFMQQAKAVKVRD